MNKAALWLGAAGVVATMAVARPASAAEMFADVPTDHWAYQAVNELQERGIVIGYPDGTFGGRRAMTRYEFAVAVDRLVDWITRSFADVEAELDKLRGNQGGPAGISEERVRQLIEEATRDLATKEDLRNLPTREDVENVRRLVNEFRDELSALGTNVETLRRELDSLKGRVGAIEERLDKWHFSGEATMIARGERAENENMGALGRVRAIPVDLDSRTNLNGTDQILQDLKTLYSLDFGITGNLGNGVTANALVNYGNYLPWADSGRLNPGVNSAAASPLTQGHAPDVSQIDPVGSGGGPGYPLGHIVSNALTNGRVPTQGNLGKAATNTSFSEFTPLKLYLNAPVRDFLFFKDLDATVGKFGIQFTPYTLQKVDPDSYTNVTLTDNGEVITTGVMGNASIGGLHLKGYAGTHFVGRAFDTSVNSGYGVFSSWGGPTVLSAMTYGAYPWDQSAGIRANYQLGRFSLGGTYIQAGLTPTRHTGNAALPPFSDLSTWGNRPNSNNGGRRMLPQRAEVYGGDIRFPLFGNFALAGEIAASDILAGSDWGDRKSVYPSDLKFAYDAKLTYNAGRLSVAGGYKQVDPFFGAPGSWGQIGRWKNPTNIQGWNAAAGYDIGPFTLKGSFADYESVRVNLNTSRLPVGSAGGPPAVVGFMPTLSDAFENDIQHWKVGVSFNLTPANNVDLGYEQAKIQPFDAAAVRAGWGDGETKETYWTIGLGHTFNKNTLFKVMYQIVDYEDNGAGLYTVPGGNYRGGIGVTQLTVRF